MMNGGLGDDTYVFTHDDGLDTILFFEGAGAAGGDVIRLVSNLNGSGITDATGAIARTQFGGNGNAVIDFGGGTVITIVGVSEFTTDDFSFF